MILSIIIVTFNSSEKIGHCIRSILSTLNIDDIEIIVVDNNSLDNTVETIKQFPGIVLIQNENKGFANGCNLGAKNSRGKYLLFLNPDTRVTQGALQNVIHYLSSNQEIGVVGPKLILPNSQVQRSFQRYYTPWSILLIRTCLKKFFKKTYNWHYYQDIPNNTCNFPLEVDWLVGGALGIPKGVFDMAGGFDDRFFMYFEDVDICFRINKIGKRVMYNPNIAIYHDHTRASANGINKQTLLHLISYAKYLWKRKSI